MMMRTIELAGRPIAVMGGSPDEVEDFARSKAFESDLMVFEGEDGRPLWDGKGVLEPYVREAWPEEVAAYQRNFAKAVADGDADPGDDQWLVFLPTTRDASGSEN